jgi:hypothetical protein
VNRDQLIARFVAMSTPGRLETARRRLAQFEKHPDFAALPDCKRARFALKIAGEFCDLKQWERADAQLYAFDAATNAATARLLMASEQNRRVAAGKKSGERRNRDAVIIAHHRTLVARDGNSAKATAACGKKFKLTLGQIRRIIAAKK